MCLTPRKADACSLHRMEAGPRGQIHESDLCDPCVSSQLEISKTFSFTSGKIDCLLCVALFAFPLSLMTLPSHRPAIYFFFPVLHHSANFPD